MSITVTPCRNDLSGLTGVYLVTGLGKRAIQVAIRPFYRRLNSEVDLATVAAHFAHKRGWKKAIIAPDDFAGEDVRIFNMDQFFIGNLFHNKQGFSSAKRPVTKSAPATATHSSAFSNTKRCPMN